ncbi:unnamed protein product [Haemonchus placei]|uniref:Obg domain-containing protein n=1 Tax=Haemonchus placei TaxID=6290 RepID=A0A0N4X2P3_HAEPC|nr:unnamed protein product [Haemonchus placei]
MQGESECMARSEGFDQYPELVFQIFGGKGGGGKFKGSDKRVVVPRNAIHFHLLMVNNPLFSLGGGCAAVTDIAGLIHS